MNAPDNLERRARELYREASRRIDPATAGRLRAARREALAAAAAPAHLRFARMLVPAGAFAAIAVAALMVFSPRDSAPVQAPGATQTVEATDGDLPPDLGNTDPSLMQNLDFYDWLATNDSSQASR
ncbi:hypothetical protein ABZR86_22140 [Dyella marensis]|jgi:hypothetical protein|uniref:DUF3619 family protein n=1 Tax=Dyella marensis TaxID=500610 RepID=A0A1I2JPD2_9GAMM|nr:MULTISPECIES: hypothetical protein [Dyella]SFF56672.1 hypothetical protein SAMN02799615_04181 [Dyella marensis]